eukprot:GFUD01010551.1.p1 GENE.GFUD01010551.1~~GFUD01010551.1.p1  ORF type:complete len:230 (-),score=76.73 GFUD01010551.1:58-747(-)
MGDWFTIQTDNGLVMDIAGGAHGGKVTLYQHHGGNNQLWRFDDGCLVSKTGLVADIRDGNRNAGAGIIGWKRHDGINQKWSLKGNVIHSKMTDMVMEVKGGKMESGMEVIISPKNGKNNQMWYLHADRKKEEKNEQGNIPTAITSKGKDLEKKCQAGHNTSLNSTSSPPVPECPVCLEEMKPPLKIFNCRNGHLVCSECRPRLTVCTNCREEYTGRATAVEQMLRQMFD